MKSKKIIFILMALIITLGMTIDVQAASRVATITQHIKSGALADVYLGKGGVYFNNAVYTGNVTLTRMDPDNSHPSRSLHFYPRWLEVNMKVNGSALTKTKGFVYVYFNLNRQTRKAWENGDMSIYHYNQVNKKWEVCPVVRFVKTKNLPNGRLSCVISEFGLYSMASPR
jgi:hypothetical protein